MILKIAATGILILSFFSSFVDAQLRWVPKENIAGVHLRGLCVVNDSVIWASGVGGIWISSSDAGASWSKGVIQGADSLDFRDIHALDAKTAWVLSAGNIGRIYFTKDRGETWELQYENNETGVFFDGFAFWDDKSGIAYSDPINGKFLVIKTKDAGQTWLQIDSTALPAVLKDEAGFAASGTGICIYGDSLVWMATGGGTRARVFKSTNRGATWNVYDTPLKSGGGTGIFSMAFLNKNEGVIVGGDYVDSTNSDKNCAITSDGGLTWQLVIKGNPRGYRSCVTIISGTKLITTGRTGSEFSHAKGRSWTGFSSDGYYSCDCTPRVCWAVGRNGKMALLKSRDGP
ncbi:MAG: oxidoreductase [Bacteroidetes bacterium]|nr:MAG: oxidoreductase [Bacteroidota bacterium]